MATSPVRKRVRPVYLKVIHDKFGKYEGHRVLIFSKDPSKDSTNDNEVLEELPYEEYAPYIKGLPPTSKAGKVFKAIWELKIQKTRKKAPVEPEVQEEELPNDESE